MQRVRKWLTFVGVSTSHPLAFLVVGVYVIVWLAFDPGSFNWQSTATVATWIMTLFIQRAEHRDTQAIHAKLDELLRAEGKARDELTMVDQREPEEIEVIGRWRSVTDKTKHETTDAARLGRIAN
jgi:low affinity Fe/Cu permease